MKKLIVVIATILLLGSALACNITPQIPDIDIKVPTLEVGEMQEERHSIPLAGVDEADVKVILGAGKLELEAGISDELFSGYFRYNVKQWEPEITREDSKLTVKQGGNRDSWGIPTGNVRNRWELEFSPEVPLEMDVKAGAGDGELDLTDLQLTALDVDIGAGDFVLRFDEPNQATMDHLTVDTGASKIEVRQIGNADPEQVKLRGGVGDISLDLTGAWTHSADVKITAGAGSLTVRFPDDLGVLVEVEGGLSNVKAPGLKQVGDTYVNDAFGKAETELHVQITTGVGNVRLVEVHN